MPDSRFTSSPRASRTSLRFTRFTGKRNSRSFGYAAPAQAAKADPALTKTTAVAFLIFTDGYYRILYKATNWQARVFVIILNLFSYGKDKL